MAKSSQITDILILGVISGIVALLTSLLGVSGTIIGSVFSSIIAEVLKRYFKDPVTDKISEYEENQNKNYGQYGYQNEYETVKNNYSYNTPTQKQGSSSIITTKVLFLFPLVVILIIELIHFLGKVGIIPIDIFYSIESIANWQLLKTIGYALIIMGLYPFFTKNLSSKHGVLLIIVGLIELMFGYGDTFNIPLLYMLTGSLKDYLNIAIIIMILYIILTVPDEKAQTQTTTQTYSPRPPRDNYQYNNNQQYNNNRYNNNHYSNDHIQNHNNKFTNQRRRHPGNNQQPQNRRDTIDEFYDEDDYYF